jgi:hypothetical protein
VTVNWDEYEIYDPGVAAPLNLVTRAEARRMFDKAMSEKPARVETLRRLLRANGVELGNTDAAIQDLNDWFVAKVEPDPENPGRLTPEWYSIVHDVALFLGEVIIERCQGLRWELFVGGKKDVSYQRHVITGFTDVSNPKYNLDLTRRVATYGHRLVASHGSVAQHGTVTVRGVDIDVGAAVARQPAREIEPDAFWRWVKRAESQA